MHAPNQNHARSQNNVALIGCQKIGSCDYTNHVYNQPKSFTQSECIMLTAKFMHTGKVMHTTKIIHLTKKHAHRVHQKL